MLTVDRKVPWGRPAEDVIARRRQRKAITMHRQRLKDTAPGVDRQVPDSSSMNHLKHRAKKRQMADDRLQVIANENRKLMEKMAAIMRKKGPGAAGSKSRSPNKPKEKGEAIYNATPLHEVTRRKEQKRIQAENRSILARIRNGKNTKSFYDHKDMGRHEKERIKYIKNISKSFQREMRVKKAAARKKMMMSSAAPAGFALSSGSVASGADASYGYGSVLEGGMGISLHTAKQIREDVATQRGMPLPDIISRRPGEGRVGRKPGQQQQRRSKASAEGSEKFVLSHAGAAPAGLGFGSDFASSLPSAGPEIGGSFADGGDWGDYDYGSADGGNFHGRGYSAAGEKRPGTTAQSHNRPGTTAQSERTNGEEEEEEEE